MVLKYYLLRSLPARIYDAVSIPPNMIPYIGWNLDLQRTINIWGGLKKLTYHTYILDLSFDQQRCVNLVKIQALQILVWQLISA
mgnify:CR=1 FL=1